MAVNNQPNAINYALADGHLKGNYAHLNEETQPDHISHKDLLWSQLNYSTRLFFNVTIKYYVFTVHFLALHSRTGTLMQKL